jgi:hypothetical protein
MRPNYLIRFSSLVIALLTSLALTAQVTTATLTGRVSDAKGGNMPGAKVVAIHVPSGTQYATITNDEGWYIVPNARVGGPYRVTVSSVGSKEVKIEDIYLNLGQKTPVDVTLTDGTVELTGVEISANANSPINNKRTGATSNISNEQLRTLPTISRSAADYTRLTPSSDGNSFGGRNDQFNNFSLDGSIFNNPFGLDAATPGGQSDAQPVSLDAIEQIQVALAPYDVTQAGFTGASVNAVTKSGTNQLKGTAFTFYRNQDMTGGSVNGQKFTRADLSQTQSGFSLGGALIQNKLFFFTNLEVERRSDLGSAFKAFRGTTGEGISRVAASDLDAVQAALKNKFGYETGVYEGYTHKTANTKGIAKLDWNINDNHKLTATYNFLDASKDKPAHPAAIGRRGPDFTTLQFYNSGYRINNKLNSAIVELKSIFGNKFSNKLQVGYTKFTDTRDPFSAAFPVVSIQKDGSRYIVAGHEPFSIYNKLNQRVLQFTDNFTMYLKNHTLTAGVSYEKFEFDNAFNLNAYGGTFGDFPSVQAFLDTVARSTAYAAEVAAARTKGQNNKINDWNWSYTNLGQVAVYLQDEWQAAKNLTITAGLRMDKPMYFNTVDKIREKLAKECCYDPTIQYYNEAGTPVKLDHTVLPSTAPLFSPRVGFNYDVKGDRSMQVRGGTGLFTGRFPFVWISNQVANPNFFFYCITSPDFQFPQVWRSNLGYDMKLPDNWFVSADLIYTKDMNGMMVRNYGLKLPSATLNAPGDTRKIYGAGDRATVFGGATNAYVFTNTNVGSATNFTLELKKNWKNGMYMQFGYNYGLSYDASSIEAEITSDAYDRNPAYGHVNEAVAAPSVYGNLHRLIGAGSKKWKYGNMATTVSAFFQYIKGGRFSYTYSGDLNNDGSGNNDLMFIPTDGQVDQMKFGGDAAAQAAQKTALKAYIAQDDYMNANRGKVVEKYGLLSPWYNNWDLRVLQDFSFKVAENKTNAIQVSLDLLNAGNLLSSKWGVRRLPTNTQPLGVNVGAGNVPTYSFDTALKSTFTPDYGLLSRWQLQLGVRYLFGN